MSIKQEDLEFLSNEQIKAFYKAEDIMLMPSPIKEFVLTGKDRFEMGRKINRVEKLLNNIIVKRFLQQLIVNEDEVFSPDCKPVQTVGELKAILNTFDDGDIVVLEATDEDVEVPQLKDEFDVSDFGSFMIDNSLLKRIGSKA